MRTEIVIRLSNHAQSTFDIHKIVKLESKMGRGFLLLMNSRKVESRHILMFILTISIPGFAFLLAGCSSSYASLPNIYLISLSYQNLTLDSASGINKNLSSLFTSLVDDAQLTVRTGYFGFCISLKTEDWICRTSVAGLREHVNATQDPLNLIDI